MTGAQAIIAAALAGAVAAPHCFAMCGPLALAGCSHHVRDGVGYYLGRGLAYAAVGAVFGHVGQRALGWVALDTLQAAAAVSLALFCIWRGIKTLRRRSAPPIALRRSAAAPSLVPLPARGFGLGMVTAVLPCGALLAAWLISAATAHALTGAAAMFVFSISSAPGTLAALLGRRAIAARLHKLPRAALASAWFVTALLVLGRMWLAASQTQCH